jgi:hypothetical protein
MAGRIYWSNLMGIVSAERFSHFIDEELVSVYNFLRNDWTNEGP